MNQTQTIPTLIDIIVIGAGPAGMTAAIYAKRANHSVILLESMAPGGQINKTAHVDNYPGFTTIEGPMLAYNMFDQTQKLEIPYLYGNVIDVIDHGDHKEVITETETYLGKTIIIATGRQPRELGLANEKALTGRGISWCAICDGAFFKEKDVAVVGGGNSALEESLFLADIVNHVYIIHRRDVFRADEIIQKRVENNPKITVISNFCVEKINEKENKLDSLTIRSCINDELKEIMVKGLFIYIGFIPRLEPFSKLKLDIDDSYIIVNNKMETNVKGVYACGDIIKKDLYQIATAIGEGATAAMSAIKDLEK